MRYFKFWLKVIFLLLLWGILLPRMVHAQPGAPDPSFGGGDGFSTANFLADAHANPLAVVVQPDNRIVVAGGTWQPNVQGTGSMALIRYMPNGQPDPTFGSGDAKVVHVLAGFEIGIEAMLLLPNGKILCTGGAWVDNGESKIMLARFNADGLPDNSFDGDGILTTQIGVGDQYGQSIALQPDGKILVAGYANIDGYEDFLLLRYNANGTLDQAFGGGDGIVTTSLGESYAGVEKVLLQPDGKIIAAGYAVSNGFDDFAIVRYKPNGDLDNTFHGDGKYIVNLSGKNERIYDALLQPDGKIVTVGPIFNDSGTDTQFGILRFNPNGTLDQDFGGGDGKAIVNVSASAEYAIATVLQPDGKIIVGGHSRPADNALYQFTLLRINANGTPDPDFSGDGTVIFPVSSSGSFMTDMVLQTDGKLVAVGRATYNNTSSFVVTRFLTGLTVDTTVPAAVSGKISFYPNPAQEQATLEFELQTTQTITLNLYDLQGRFIQNILPNTEKTAGKHTETLFFNSNLPAGAYLLSLETSSGVTTIEVIF